MRLLAWMVAVLMSSNLFAADLDLAALKKGQLVSGFNVEAVYLDDTNRPMGARFVHARSGFTLDVLRIESVPQGYTWVNSFPTSDQGEPHTQEHLLLGKGVTGRTFAGLDTMWLSQSTAFTQQWRTSYHFNTSAGADVFFDLFAAELNAMLHPDYTDEEVRREVRNFGVTENPDKSLRLEEKGSVYNEMVSSSANQFRVMSRAARHLIYGTAHPLAYNSGGEPSGIRTMQPDDIRRFHQANYYLANMGTIVAIPKSVTVSDVLKRSDAILTKVEKEPKKRSAMTFADIPAPAAAPAGTVAVAEYPHRNEQQPSAVTIAWPANRSLDANEMVLLDLFLASIAGDPTTNFYKIFIDSKTRTMDVGARSVYYTFSQNDMGQPLAIGLTDVAAANLNEEKLGAIRESITREIARIAALPDDSPELAQLHARIASRTTELERELAKFVSSPPGFGFRGTGSGWMDQLLTIEKTGSFARSVTMKPQIAWVRAQLAKGTNIWRELLPKWKVTGVVPYAVAARPSPALLQREEAERVARSTAEANRLLAHYKVQDVQDAIRRYQVESDREGAAIEEAAKKIAPPEFVKSPPMELDEALVYETRRAGSATASIPLVASTFDNMTSAQLGLALRLDGVPVDHLRYVSLLPVLLTRVGVIENGKPVPYEEMAERLRKEILGLEPSFVTNPRTSRVELVVRGSGIGVAEASRAIDWMTLVLQHPDWRPENLARIRDVVDQSLSALRNAMSGSEESWVNNPSNAYRMQTNPHFLAADSMLTRAHNALRMRWLLKEAAPSDLQPVSAFLTQLAGVTGSRADYKALIKEISERKAGAPTSTNAVVTSFDALSPAGRTIALDALRDIDLTLIDIPESSLTADWAYLANAMREDLSQPPATVLARLNDVRKMILRRDNGRMFLVGSAATQKALQPKIDALAGLLSGDAVSRPGPSAPLVNTRAKARDAAATFQHVGLVAPNMKGGVVITSVPSVHYSDYADTEKQLDYLSTRLFAGYGAHGIFLKTIGAGLAYSNGVRGGVGNARVGYYAERTPELPQTIRFVVDTIRTSQRMPSLADYTIAQIFGELRSAATYEARAEGMASDLVDNQPPDMVRRFRQSILTLRKDPQLGEKLFDRKDAVHARILPGYDASQQPVPGSIFFTIGPDKQLDAYDSYVQSSAGGARLTRIYPRDFWMP